MNKIEGLALDEEENDLLAMTIRLPENVCLECLFQASMKGEAERLVKEFQIR